MKGVLFLAWVIICRNECPSQVFHGIQRFMVFLTAAVHWKDAHNFTDYGILSIDWIYPVCACVSVGSEWINFFVDIKWIHVVTLRLFPASVCLGVFWGGWEYRGME
jgi:hypothetical protein